MPRWFVRCSLAAATIVALATTGEVVLRARASAFRADLEATAGWSPDHACNQADPRLVYRGVENRCGANSQGFVDAEHAFEKPRGVFRVVVIGDSIALGHPNAYRHSFAHVLERLLREACSDREVEVVVLATVGYSSEQELVLLEEDASRYHPDLVLWSYCLNDPAHPYRHDPNGQLGRYYHRPQSYLADFFAEKIFFARESWRAQTRRCPSEFHAFLHCAYADEVAATFAALGRWQAQTHVPVVVAIHPLIEQNRPPERYSLSDLHQHLVDLARANGLVGIDLLPAYQGHSWQEVGLGYRDRWFDCYHPNQLGHEILGRYLQRELIAEGLVACASPQGES